MYENWFLFRLFLNVLFLNKKHLMLFNLFINFYHFSYRYIYIDKNSGNFYNIVKALTNTATRCNLIK